MARSARPRPRLEASRRPYSSQSRRAAKAARARSWSALLSAPGQIARSSRMASSALIPPRIKCAASTVAVRPCPIRQCTTAGTPWARCQSRNASACRSWSGAGAVRSANRQMKARQAMPGQGAGSQRQLSHRQYRADPLHAQPGQIGIQPLLLAIAPARPRTACQHVQNQPVESLQCHFRPPARVMSADSPAVASVHTSSVRHGNAGATGHLGGKSPAHSARKPLAHRGPGPWMITRRGFTGHDQLLRRLRRPPPSRCRQRRARPIIAAAANDRAQPWQRRRRRVAAHHLSRRSTRECISSVSPVSSACSRSADPAVHAEAPIGLVACAPASSGSPIRRQRASCRNSCSRPLSYVRYSHRRCGQAPIDD